MRLNSLILGLSHLFANYSTPNFAMSANGAYPNLRRNSGAAQIKREARKNRNRSRR